MDKIGYRERIAAIRKELQNLRDEIHLDCPNGELVLTRCAIRHACHEMQEAYQQIQQFIKHGEEFV